MRDPPRPARDLRTLPTMPPPRIEENEPAPRPARSRRSDPSSSPDKPGRWSPLPSDETSDTGVGPVTGSVARVRVPARVRIASSNLPDLPNRDETTAAAGCSPCTKRPCLRTALSEPLTSRVRTTCRRFSSEVLFPRPRQTIPALTVRMAQSRGRFDPCATNRRLIPLAFGALPTVPP